VLVPFDQRVDLRDEYMAAILVLGTQITQVFSVPKQRPLSLFIPAPLPHTQ
jgi:hypothetical protein